MDDTLIVKPTHFERAVICFLRKAMSNKVAGVELAVSRVMVGSRRRILIGRIWANRISGEWFSIGFEHPDGNGNPIETTWVDDEELERITQQTRKLYMSREYFVGMNTGWMTVMDNPFESQTKEEIIMLSDMGR